jgi:hypothetical protein
MAPNSRETFEGSLAKLADALMLQIFDLLVAIHRRMVDPRLQCSLEMRKRLGGTPESKRFANIISPFFT